MHDKQIRELTVDKEFAGLCPALKPEELSLLEASLDREGCRDAIVVWANHDDTILDGHNRYRYCRRFGVPFKTKAMVLEDRNAVRNWIVENQLGKRNLTDEQKSYLRGQRYITEKNIHGGDRKSGKHDGNDEKSRRQNDALIAHEPVENNGVKKTPLRTRDKLAAEYNVGFKTIERDAKYAVAIDTIASNAGQGAKQAILSGELPMKKCEVLLFAEMPANEQKAAVAGGAQAVKAAVGGRGVRHRHTIANSHKDASGVELTGPAREASEENKRLSLDALDALSALRKALLGFKNSALNSGAWIHVGKLLSEVTEMRQQIKNGSPHASCGDCRGHGCPKCNRCGFLNKGAFEKWSKHDPEA